MSDDEQKDEKKVVPIEKAKPGTAAAAKKRKAEEKPEGEEEKPKLNAAQIRTIIEWWVFEHLKWEVNPVTGVILSERHNEDGNHTLPQAAEDVVYERTGVAPTISEKQVAGTLRRIISDKRKEVWDAMRKRHGQKRAGRPIDNHFIEEFLRCILHPDAIQDPIRFQNAVFAMRQWIWNVKQRLMRRPDKDHIMLGFHGDGGSGKSTLIRKFIGAFGPLADQITLKVYDSGLFLHDPLHQLLIGMADEANGEDDIKESEIKNGMSSEIVLGRNMYGAQMPRSKRNLTPIMCRNGEGVWKLCRGDRRIVNLRCRDGQAIDHKDDLNYAASIIDDVWNSVFFDEPNPGSDKVALKQLRDEQRRHATEEGFVNTWLEVCCEKNEAGVTKDEVPYAMVKASMGLFARETGASKKEIPRNKDDMKAAMEAASAVMVTTDNRYRLTSHYIRSRYAP